MANICIFSGNLTTDPDIRYTAEGKGVTTLRLAVNNGKRGGKDSTLFLDIDVWNSEIGKNGQADYCATYLHKGSKVLVHGSLQGARPWKTNKDELRADIKVRAIAVDFLDPRPQSDEE